MRIVMTGATSGIGLCAAESLKAKADLTVGVRDPVAARRILGPAVRVERLDLADLRSAANFADAVAAGPPIDRLILNAGTQVVTGVRSAQGLELTFAANHLAHFLILRQLTPHLAPEARVILTASGTHDPDLKTGVPPPVTADAWRLAHPERDLEPDPNLARAGRRAYSSSKLCNVMTAREFAARIGETRSDVATAAFDPGFTSGTNLARDYAPWQQFVFRHVMGLVIRGEGVSTPKASGRCLAELALEANYAAARGDYFAVRSRRLKPTVPSALARDDAACAKLWTDSEALIAQAGL